ncbi:histone deacetylase family protein [Elioraea sp. Yellowstone]|jgi:acetoin utilization deacetylase AcuC-like enzyme/GNAT superfamily N-acetyltransferase|uniref:histone deacetylase family protein n=1 Tax=Elioraea sp. Yellowstone TaxID=2592070 RepID=UPI00115126CF|nr:histone deacetylase family protein [Elioraea sp. Yellowstone]TQF84510.1 histone deacetylase family protein [Elioraea sp. Yellowstone]
MIRIRRIADDAARIDRDAIEAAVRLLRAAFPAARAGEFETLPRLLRRGGPDRVRPFLLVAENGFGRVRGAAILWHMPDVGVLWLDYIAGAEGARGGGIGGALYQRARELAVGLGAQVLLFECLPDDPAVVPDPALRAANARRLRFYARFGARPLVGTDYERPIPGETGPMPPLLVVDLLDRREAWPAAEARAAIRAVLTRKYGRMVSPGYVERVVGSVRDDPVRLRPAPRPARALPAPRLAAGPAMTLVVNDLHEIHHVRERGYVEAPVRVREILEHLPRAVPLRNLPARPFPDGAITAVHDRGLVAYLRAACAEVGEGRAVYPYVFPIRNATRPPKDLALRAGYFCIDTFTPITGNAWKAARRAVDCALTAAEAVLGGERLAYALVRPPGHHAERRAFGGFCYFNNAAVAAELMSRFGRCVVLDIDYHHGNGTQDIFYARADVLTISIHGDPAIAYPYFSGFRDERGEGAGAGFNLNLPLPEAASPAQFAEALETACRRIARHDPRFLVIAAGFDTAAGDPTGSWRHRPDDFRRIGARLAGLNLPTLVVQEGGYRTRTLGTNAAAFFAGLWTGRA